MSVSESIGQQPEPASKHSVFRGDVFRFRLEAPGRSGGSAWLRTNIGRAGAARAEVIRHVEKKEAILHLDWHDIAMVRTGEACFEVALPLCEVGHFEAKAYYLPEGGDSPFWPPGPNTVINVEPAETVCGNIIYNAFIRQFGPNKHQRRVPPADADFTPLDRLHYTVIPPSGKFRDLVRELDFIIGRLGCPYIQLMPVHPTPTTYGRMGRFGSPYAAQSFTAVDPAMAEFDPRATPLEQFMELVDAVHARHGRIILDIAINHTGWGASIHETAPHWLQRGEDGKIQMPGAWGVVWEDLAKLDYRHRDLWQYMAGVFLTWCRRGVDGFRCDAGYMIPAEAWRYIVACVREQFPDTVFFLEGLGGRISVTRDILDTAGFNWAYSELFQNYDRDGVCGHMALVNDVCAKEGIMVHFAETHDNDRLASVSRTFARMRTALCALLSHAGGFAFANGVEWFATEKIDVHDAPSLNWGAEENQVDHIRRLNAILKTHPVFCARGRQRFIMAGEGNFVAVLRFVPESKEALVVVVNLDAGREVTARWQPELDPMEDGHLIDLITGERVFVEPAAGAHQRQLAPGQALCLGAVPEDLARIEEFENAGDPVVECRQYQQLRAAALDVFRHYHGTAHIGAFDPDAAALELARDPEAFLRRMNPETGESRAVVWQWPEDLKREVMVPPGHFLLVFAPRHFRVRLIADGRVLFSAYALACWKEGRFALAPPVEPLRDHRPVELRITLYEEESPVHETASLLLLARPETVGVRRALGRAELIDRPFMFLATNGRGAMMRASTFPRRMRSRYDALLAANPDPEMPVDRWIMLSRCRMWLVYQDYSQAVRTDCLRRFFFDYDNRARWQYLVPTGLGYRIRFSVEMEMTPGENRVRICFFRHAKDRADQLEDDRPVRLIVRPDMENRCFHDTTKAYTGPEHAWPQAVGLREHGFSFRPDAAHSIDVTAPGAGFVTEPEWQYMVYRPVEAERGLDPHSDLFSPGYFHCRLKGGQCLAMEASMEKPGRPTPPRNPKTLFSDRPETGKAIPLIEAMDRAMRHYVVGRGAWKSVIAGYPWFLDWGRDSLIFCRALIAAGALADARDIIRLFGRFEEGGTLPNMIHGDDARNRDTSDAPLWFMIACRDLAEASGGPDVLDEPVDGRSLREILFSIAAGYIRGTAGGIRVDPETGLVFSPAHFTWMDTNFPAATPRQGYPVEIQALWYAGLRFLAGLEPPARPAPPFDPEDIAGRVAKAVQHYYFNDKHGFLSDCLHGEAGQKPAQAVADDALRPNQVFAVTMDAVRDTEICRRVLSACARLLVPGAIRSLADRPVGVPLEIRHNGRLIGDPYHPYRGRYAGDEDTSRKPAYHNGTAWTWVFPSFCEAWVKVYGKKSIPTAMAWLGSSSRIINEGCLGHVPEILDGDAPHHQRGCDAQAWGASELYRVLKHLETEAAG